MTDFTFIPHPKHVVVLEIFAWLHSLLIMLSLVVYIIDVSALNNYLWTIPTMDILSPIMIISTAFNDKLARDLCRLYQMLMFVAKIMMMFIIAPALFHFYNFFVWEEFMHFCCFGAISFFSALISLLEVVYLKILANKKFV